MGMGRREESKDCLASCMQMNDLVLWGESEDLRSIVGGLIKVCRKRGLRVNAGKSKVMVLGGEEGLECEV